MPYQLFKFGKNEYKVGIVDNRPMSNGRLYLSNKPLPRNHAVKQLYAVHFQEFGVEDGAPTLIIDKRHYNSPEPKRKKLILRNIPYTDIDISNNGRNYGNDCRTIISA